MATTRRTHMRRALACVAAAACCVVGVSSPSDAADTPVPVPSSPVSQAPELPLLPGRGIKMAASLAPSASDDMGVGERVSVCFFARLADRCWRGRRAPPPGRRGGNHLGTAPHKLTHPLG